MIVTTGREPKKKSLIATFFEMLGLKLKSEKIAKSRDRKKYDLDNRVITIERNCLA